MRQNEITQHNSISIVGKVSTPLTFSHEVYGEGFYSFDAEVKRLSEAADILPVTVSERLMDPAAPLEVGTEIEVIGQLRSYNNYSGKKTRLLLTIFAKELNILDGDAEQYDSNPNQTYLDGFICKPPIYRTTPFGREIADLLLAVNRSYSKSDYIPCIAWGRNAKFGGKLSVGDNIRIWGRMQSRPYQKKLETGEVLDKVALEVSIAKLEVVTRKDVDGNI